MTALGGRWLWTLLGVAYGLSLRILFGAAPAWLNRHSGVMSIAFLVATPFVVGALTVYGDRCERQTISQMIFAPWIAILLMMLGAAVSLLEGSICIALLSPLFLGCASIGGLTMGLAMRLLDHHKSSLKAVVLLPIAIFAGEGRLPQPDHLLEMRTSVTVDARPETVWAEILTARAIKAHELPFSLTHMIGVPRPIEGVNVMTPVGEIRYSRWERGVNFRGVVTDRKDNKSISWRYVFDEGSFPPGSMDEHVAIGGLYFNLHDTTFNLHPLHDGGTRLEIVAHYRVSTSINFYAVPAANLLGRDFTRTILALYKRRSECAEGTRTC